MAQINQTQINLIETALDAPLSKLELEAVEAMAQAIAEGPSQLEMDSLRQLKVRLLIVQRSNQIKEERR